MKTKFVCLVLLFLFCHRHKHTAHKLQQKRMKSGKQKGTTRNDDDDDDNDDDDDHHRSDMVKMKKKPHSNDNIHNSQCQTPKMFSGKLQSNANNRSHFLQTGASRHCIVNRLFSILLFFSFDPSVTKGAVKQENLKSFAIILKC